MSYESLLVILAALVTASLIVGGALVLHQFLLSAPESQARQAGQQNPGQARRRQVLEATGEDEEDAAPERASTSRRSAKKRRNQVRREAARQAQAIAAINEVSDHSDDEEDGELNLAKSAYELAREDKERHREAQELAEEEERREAQELKERQQQEEFNRWKSMFSVDGTGQDVETDEQVEQRRAAMCSTVKAAKVMELQELSSTFGLRGAEVVAEIQYLEACGQLSGIMDDRGKYIHLSMEELQELADLIKREGRISISRLAQEATDVLRLSPTATTASGASVEVHEQALDAIMAV